MADQPSSSSASPSNEGKEAQKPTRSLRVRTRNEAISIIYRRLIGTALLALMAAAVSVMAMLGVISKPVPPQYMAVSPTGQLLTQLPLSKPNASRSEVAEFALRAVRALYTYDYVNYRDQFNAAQAYFSPAGWEAYKDDYAKSKTIDAVVSRKMVVSVEPTGEVKFRGEGLSEKTGLYAWRFEIPVQITYHANGVTKEGIADSGNRQEGSIVLLITRVPDTQNPEGYAIQLHNFVNKK